MTVPLIDSSVLADQVRDYTQRFLESLSADDEKMLLAVEGALRRAAADQAVLDATMLEYCAGDMTEEQVERWARHQVRCSPAEEEAIKEALREKGNLKDPL